MNNQSILRCSDMGQVLELNLSNQSPDMSSVDFSKCNTVFEDGWYEIDFLCDNYSPHQVESVIINVNGTQVGLLKFDKENEHLSGSVTFQREQENNGKSSGQPFLLQYDLVIVSFEVTFSDGTIKELFTDFLLCVSKRQEDIDNINQMIEAITVFDDSQIGEWLFSGTTKNSGTALREGKWHHHAYKSLGSYIQLLESVIACYRSNYAYFRSMGKHTIKRNSILQSYKNVKTVTLNSFQWLMQNSNQMAEVPLTSGIQYRGKSYLPSKIKAEVNQKSWDVYENQVVLCFLHTVLTNAKLIHSEFDKDVLNEERILTRINGSIPKEYRAPIITIKSLQISFCRILLDKLADAIKTLQSLYTQYKSLFDVKIAILTSLPRKTKTFQEIKPYTQVFAIIFRWFNYGEFSLEKERLILQVKTLDKLFEYFCLIELLKLFTERGYQKKNVDQPAFKFEYSVSDGFYQNEKDVANTYLLYKDDVELTVYYQPVISASQFQNNIALYRTTKPKVGRPDYYSPDFVLKFMAANGKEDYVILDSKFSSRSNIRKFHLPKVMNKYSHEVAAANPQCNPQMVWVLQGRVGSGESTLWRYHNSVLATRHNPRPSFGIVSINTVNNSRQRFWNELKLNIPWIY